ncbi:FHA domain-containing protein [Kouleothrix sp.]|jgi:pSer/pThr/pTyr-binding forkhead associated (FHA) protein|uniref:FHA domain-containing protein n=1 Tax=Kouleothrix sp. TaxID=2779161 RepID=UPI00391B34A2
MQLCPNCKSKQFDGTIFCADCGASLVAANRRETTLSLGQRGPTDDLPKLREPPAAPASAPRVTLVIVNSGRRMSLDVSEDLLIGRKDNAHGIFPDVDLGLDGGYDAGVSRRHAILAWSQGAYTVEDLGSSNGTFLNGQRLGHGQATPLRSGDELKCGTLLIRVEFR